MTSNQKYINNSKFYHNYAEVWQLHWKKQNPVSVQHYGFSVNETIVILSDFYLIHLFYKYMYIQVRCKFDFTQLIYSILRFSYKWK